MVYKFFDKKYKTSDIKSIPNQQLANELHQPFIINVKRRKVYSSFKDNIWGAGLTDMQLINKYDKGIRFLLCFFDRFSKYVWVIPLNNKKGITIGNAFQSISNN